MDTTMSWSEFTDTTMWCLLVKSHEILAWKEMCERICGVFRSIKTPQTPRTLSHISFHAEISRDFTYRHHNVVSFRLWTPWTLSYISFHSKISWDFTYRHHNVVSFRLWCFLDTMNSLAHHVSYRNLMRFD